MQRRKRKLITRVLQKLLAQGRGEVRAMEQAIQLEGILRFVGLFALMVLLPAILLAWYGMSSLRQEDLGVDQEVSQEASSASDQVMQVIQRQFAAFEGRVLDRLEAGHSPLVSRAELDESLVLVLQLSPQGQLKEPFRWPEGELSPLIYEIFEPEWQEAWFQEREGVDPRIVAIQYAEAARNSRSQVLKARALLDQGRMLGRAEEPIEASEVLNRVIEDYGELRGPWGFPMGDLARIEGGEVLQHEDSHAASEALEGLIRSLLERRWTLGWGTDAAIARRALALMQSPRLRDPTDSDVLAIEERVALHYWAGQLWPELSRQLSRDLPGSRDGKIHWLTGDQAIWGICRWSENLYVFALEKQPVVERLSQLIDQSIPLTHVVRGEVLSPTGIESSEVLATRNLSPWLSGWTVAVSARDPGALVDTGARRANRRLVIVLLTLALIILGVFLSARQIKRELDMARMQTNFAANVSHELRSPITQIRLKGEMLMLGMFEEKEEREDAYQAIVRESERLSRLVDNVLDFGAIERGLKQYDLRPADLSDTVHRAVDIVSSSQEVLDKTLDLSLPEVLPPVQHDPDAVVQCVINLVSNAAKYSEHGGWIGVRSRVLDQAVEITVSDKGIGIPAGDLQNIFEPFFRSEDKSARLRKGTGIGLTITRYIMRAHGGEVSVQSRPGLGSTFTLRFPCNPGDASPFYS